MNRPEMNPEEAIDRLLGGLRDVEVPREIESRILARLEDRSLAPRRWHFAAPRAWALAATCFTVTALALAWAITHHAHHAIQEMAAASPHPIPKVQNLPEARATLHAAQSHTYKSFTPAKLDRKHSEPATLTTEDAVALSDLHAPSQPAPPMPLTEQEKMLLQLVHRGETVEVAMLDAKFRSEETSSRADFDSFFGSSNPPFIKPPKPDIPSSGEKK